MEQLVKDWKDFKTRWFRSFRKLFNQTGIFTLPIFLTLKNEDPHFPWRSIFKKVPKNSKIKRPRRPDKIMKISEDSFRALRTILAKIRGPRDGTDRVLGWWKWRKDLDVAERSVLYRTGSCYITSRWQFEPSATSLPPRTYFHDSLGDFRPRDSQGIDPKFNKNCLIFIFI